MHRRLTNSLCHIPVSKKTGLSLLFSSQIRSMPLLWQAPPDRRGHAKNELGIWNKHHWCHVFIYFFTFISMILSSFWCLWKSISRLLISYSFKLLWRLVHIRSHWHSYILSLNSRNMFNYDTLLICFYFFFPSKYKKINHEHSIEIYFIQLLMSLFFVLFWHFKNKIRQKIQPDTPVTTSYSHLLSY